MKWLPNEIWNEIGLKASVGLASNLEPETIDRVAKKLGSCYIFY